ncbi:hypothetical protein PYW07_005849 [Mythimna separata]|uniref:Uncharacterized protein n=1 Tax=Mythimna separata TaxID=271217 RepID=A0AAD7YJN7_MYTSE|nr:hypothetical protein PYW07_005849 [Mythimna separata]
MDSLPSGNPVIIRTGPNSSTVRTVPRAPQGDVSKTAFCKPTLIVAGNRSQEPSRRYLGVAASFASITASQQEILKLAAIYVVLGVCFALPVEDPKVVEVAPTPEPVPLEPKPVEDEGLPKPAKPDNSDLKPDASSWWQHRWEYHEVPVYYYTKYDVPVHYTYWKIHH